MRIETLRFGEVEIPEEGVVALPEGLLGFPDAQRFCLLPYGPGEALQWLQSVEDPTLAFLAVDPYTFFPDYEVVVSDADAEWLGLERPEDAVVLSLVTISQEQTVVTANLAGPVVINIHTRRGRQVVLDDPRYVTRHLLARLEGEALKGGG